MAVTPVINFQPIMNDPWSNLFKTGSNVYSGMKQGQANNLQMQQQRQMLPYKLQEADLVNKLRQYQVQEEEAKSPYYEEIVKSELEKSRMFPQIEQSLIESRKWENALRQQKLNEANDPKKSNAQLWRGTPMDFKSEMLGRFRASGVDPFTAMQKLNDGETIEKVLADANVNPEYFWTQQPLYSPTGAVRTGAQKREASGKELEVFEDFVVEAMEPYVAPGAVTGMSVPLILDQLSGANEDQQANFWAAYALYPEMNYVRLSTAQGTSGITALKHMEERALGNISGVEKFITPSVWKKSQRILNNKIREGQSAYNKTALNPQRESPSMKIKISKPLSEYTDEELDALVSGKGG